MSVATFNLTSAVGGSSLPFSLGHSFKRGEVPAGSQLVGSVPFLQAVEKSTWSDGSLKFAIVSGRADLTANTPLTVTLSIGTASTDLHIQPGAFTRTITAMVDAGAFGQAVWTEPDWYEPFMTWVSGPYMSSFIYRKPVGSDAHLVAWLEVRVYHGGAIEILPWIENGYLLVANPTNKSATYSFTLGGTQRFSAAIDLLNHQRTPLVSGSTLSHWYEADPQVTPSHDPEYFQSTCLVPKYGAPADTAKLNGLVQTYAPLQVGNHSTAMGSGGYHPSIGLLPDWDVAYVTTGDARAYRSVVVNAYGAGRYGTHYRDETTNRVARFSSYPTLVMGGSSGVEGGGSSSTSSYTPTAGGSSPPAYKSSHHPSMGYVAYLVTGRFYFMEEVQFVATANYLKNHDTHRQGSSGVFLSNSGANTVRGAAWATRSLAHAASATPDNDIPLRTEFINSLEANVNYHHTNFVAPAIKPNIFGFVPPYANYTGGTGVYSIAPWQQDFHTAAYGLALSLDLPLSTSGKNKFVEFFAWKAQSIIGRMQNTGVDSEWPYRDAAIYYVAVATDPGTPNWLLPESWYSSWQELYETTGLDNSHGDGTLRGGNFPAMSSYWGNLQPAIAYAVQHNVEGAAEAYARVQGAPNYSALQSDFVNGIEWGVQPLDVEPIGETTTVNGACYLVDNQSLRDNFYCVSKYPGIGVHEDAMPTGFPKPALGEGRFPSDAPDGAELQIEVEIPQAGLGTLWIGEETQFSFTNAPQGVYAGLIEVTLGGVQQADDSYQMSIGTANSASPPNAPTNIIASGAGNTVTVNASVPNNNGSAITGYEVVASTGQSANSATLPISITMPYNVAATFRLRAINAIGPGPLSVPSSAVTLSAPVTGNPNQITVSVSPSTAVLPNGGTVQLTATASVAAGTVPQTFSWYTSTGTVTQTGLLYVQQTLFQQTVSVTVVSNVDPNKFAVATITVPATTVSGGEVPQITPVRRYGSNIANRFGVALEGVAVTVVNKDNGQKAKLYSDKEMTEEIYNPVLTNAEGYFEFYVEANQCSYNVDGPGIEPYIRDNIFDVFTDLDLSSIINSIQSLQNGKVSNETFSQTVGNLLPASAMNQIQAQFSSVQAQIQAINAKIQNL